METERKADRVVLRAPAKVNLFLEVLAKRPDGFHQIESLLVAVELFDTLEFREVRSDAVHLVCDIQGLSIGPENLIRVAAARVRKRTGTARGVEIRLQKEIPIAAGLAGGSTDAAATICGLNELWQLNLSRQELASIGAEIGSDVPFFLNGPVAWCTGRGEQTSPCPLGRTLWFVIVCPRRGLSTAEVYRHTSVPIQPKSCASLLEAVRTGRIDEIGRNLHNRLQPAAEALLPEIAQWRKRLAAVAPPGYLMSGSGSSLFALCHDENEAKRIAQQVSHGREEGVRPSVFLVRSCP
jgi:4-diphosphocytidyl-2-C-methyl-D-erythritol kinase